MLELYTALVAGLVAGAVHALSGPDHLAAVAPLSISNRQQATRVGLMWGLGHGAGVGGIGAVVFALRGLLSLELLSQWSERAVGIMLIGVGLWGLRRALSKWVHSHPHSHDPQAPAHAHLHVHAPGREVGLSHRHSHASLGMGLLHGVAGTSHIFGILPALALPSSSAAAFYLGGYGLGNLVSMSGFAWLVGRASGRVRHWGVRPYRVVLGTCSAVSIIIGILWLTL